MYLILTLGAVAFLYSLILTPVIRNVFQHLGVVDQPDGIRKLHLTPIPRIGGIAIVLSYIGSFATILFLPFNFRDVIEGGMPIVLRLLPAFGLIFLTGLLDDLVGLRPWQKLLEQVIASLMACWGGVIIQIFSVHSTAGLLNIPITVIWLIGCTNAFNLIDGLDGVAAGVGLFATFTMLLSALTHNNLVLAMVTVPLAGCLLGFLRYNFNPASVFLGDCGSLLIGFLLGCFGVLWSQKSVTLLGLTAPLMALAIPLLDVTLSLARRFLTNQPIFGADHGHIHHQLLKQGLTPRRAALVVYACCGIAATLSFIQNALHNEFSGLIILVFCGATWLGVQHLGYVEFGTARKLVLQGAFRELVGSHARLVQFERALAKSESLSQCGEEIITASSAFGFTSVRIKVEGVPSASVPLEPCTQWQIRISLPGGQYINFTRSLEGDLSPHIIGSFVKVVERAMSEKIASAHNKAAGPAETQPQSNLRKPPTVSEEPEAIGVGARAGS